MWPSVESLALVTGFKATAIKAARKRLEADGWLRQTGKHDLGMGRYVPIYEFPWMTDPGSPDDAENPSAHMQEDKKPSSSKRTSEEVSRSLHDPRYPPTEDYHSETRRLSEFFMDKLIASDKKSGRYRADASSPEWLYFMSQIVFDLTGSSPRLATIEYMKNVLAEAASPAWPFIKRPQQLMEQLDDVRQVVPYPERPPAPPKPPAPPAPPRPAGWLKDEWLQHQRERQAAERQRLERHYSSFPEVRPSLQDDQPEATPASASPSDEWLARRAEREKVQARISTELDAITQRLEHERKASRAREASTIRRLQTRLPRPSQRTAGRS
jgi:hypothetical protein